jgi:ComF family protein
MRPRRWLNHFLNFCFPGQCACCGQTFDTGAMFCTDCESEMETLTSAPSCRRCAMPSVTPGAPCPHCQGKGLSPFDRVIGLGVFQNPIKNAIHHAKYSHRWYVAETLAERLFERPDVQHLLQSSDCLVPVPLYRRKQIDRGYNQSEVIAQRIAALAKHKPVIRAAVRVRNTQSQTIAHSRAARVENVKDAFELTKPRAIAGKRVVVIDDVMTTGATIVSLARTLKAARPAQLSALVLAVADPKGRGFEVI